MTDDGQLSMEFDADLAFGAPDRSSVASYRLGGKTYPLKTSTECFTCQSPFRASVERAILRGYSYRTISDHLPADHAIPPRDLAHHVKSGHMPLAESVKRVIIEERAKELGRDVVEFEGNLADHITLARMVASRSFERMIDGDEEPTIDQGLRAADILARLGLGEAALDQEAAMGAFMLCITHAQAVMDAEQWSRYISALADDPELGVLSDRIEGRQPELAAG